MGKAFAFFLFGITLLSVSLKAEIELVRVKWAQGLCLKPCEEGMRRRLNNTPQIAEAIVPPGASEAQIRWKPTAPFSYPILNTIIKGAGVHIDQVFIKVKGIIVHDHNNVHLIATENGTRFTLLSPIAVSSSPSQGAARQNVDSYKLRPPQSDKLLDAEKNHQVVTIQGTLFAPWRYVDLYLVVQSSSVAPPLVKPQPQF